MSEVPAYEDRSPEFNIIPEEPCIPLCDVREEGSPERTGMTDQAVCTLRKYRPSKDGLADADHLESGRGKMITNADELALRDIAGLIYRRSSQWW